MSSISRISKEDIIKVSFKIVREKGIDGVNAREIAKRLNSSVQPIFYHFSNMEDLKKEVLNYSLDYYKKFILNFETNEPKYKQIGINYIKFAREESNLFKFIFMGDYHIKIEEFSSFDDSYKQVEAFLNVQNQISSNKVERFHLKMWIFTHGIACLIATNTCLFSDDEISILLTEEYQALIKDVIDK